MKRTIVLAMLILPILSCHAIAFAQESALRKTANESAAKAQAPAAVDKAAVTYKEAVALYWDGRYSEAQAKFNQVQNMSPGYSRTGYYLGRVNEKLSGVQKPPKETAAKMKSAVAEKTDEEAIAKAKLAAEQKAAEEAAAARIAEESAAKAKLAAEQKAAEERALNAKLAAEKKAAEEAAAKAKLAEKSREQKSAPVKLPAQQNFAKKETKVKVKTTAPDDASSREKAKAEASAKAKLAAEKKAAKE